MGQDERDRKRTEEEPEVEAHYNKVRSRDGEQPAPEDKADDTPDVEAHYNKVRS